MHVRFISPSSVRSSVSTVSQFLYLRICVCARIFTYLPASLCVSLMSHASRHLICRLQAPINSTAIWVTDVGWYTVGLLGLYSARNPSANKKTVFFPCKHFAILDTIKIFSINLDLRSVNIMNNLTFHAFVFSAEAYTPCIAIHAPLWIEIKFPQLFCRALLSNGFLLGFHCKTTRSSYVWFT